MQPTEIVLIAALLVYLIGRRLQGVPLRAGRLLVLPVVLLVLGITQLDHPDGARIAMVAVEALVGLGLGLLRGSTIALYERAGYLWMRYRPVTVVIWLATILVRVGLGIHQSGASAGLTIGLAVSLLGEGALTTIRAQRTGVPLAPDRRTARAAVSPNDRNR